VVNTDCNGKGMTTIVVGNTSTKSKVIVEASATVSGKKVSSFTSFDVQPSQVAMTLSLDHSVIAQSVGQVLATATVTAADGTPVQGCPVTFSIASGPASLAPGLGPVNSDASGKALGQIIPGASSSTSNVVVAATATANGQTVSAYAPFQIVRLRWDFLCHQQQQRRAPRRRQCGRGLRLSRQAFPVPAAGALHGEGRQRQSSGWGTGDADGRQPTDRVRHGKHHQPHRDERL
jgi:hypothetical protein